MQPFSVLQPSLGSCKCKIAKRHVCGVGLPDFNPHNHEVAAVKIHRPPCIRTIYTILPIVYEGNGLIVIPFFI